MKNRLSLNAFSTYIPPDMISIRSLRAETNLSCAMLSIFYSFYGLRSIAVYRSGGVFSLIEKSLGKIGFSSIDSRKINYLIYLHTADFVVPYGESVLTYTQKKLNLHCTYAFEISFARCASYFVTLALLKKILRSKSDTALVLTGEIAFTPKLRVVPHSTLVSDASTAAIWSFSNEQHQVLSIVNHFFKGYEKGIYLTPLELEKFDRQFIESIAIVINKAIFKAKLTLNDITIILPSNVNISTWTKVSKKLAIPLDKFYLKNIPLIAHTFCSDHLINLESAVLENFLKSGDYYIMVGCGLGFYLSAAVFQM